MAKIYTKTGDQGETGVLASERYRKNDPRIEAYGTVDELNACLGIARAWGPAPALARVLPGMEHRGDPKAGLVPEPSPRWPFADLLAQLQDELFVLGSALADPSPTGPFFHAITEQHVLGLERLIDQWQGQLPALQQFILPGGAPAAAAIHLARTVCRRAERAVVTLLGTPEAQVAPAVLIYLNRLSDWLFVLSRAINQHAGVPDTPWTGMRPPPNP